MQIKLIKRLIQVMQHLFSKIVIAVMFATLGFLATVGIPALVLKGTFSMINNEQVDWTILLISVVSLGILRGVFRYGEHYFGHYVAFRSLADLRGMIFRKLRQLAPAKLDTKTSGELLKMIGEDIEALEVFFAHTLPPVMTASVVTLLLSIYYAQFSVGILSIALITYALLAIVVPVCFAKFLQPLLTEQSNARKQYISLFVDSLKGMADLQQYQQVGNYLTQLDKKSQYVNEKEKQVYEGQAIQTTCTFFIVGLAILYVAAYSVYLVQKGHLSVYQASVVTTVFSTSFAPYLELSRLPFGFKKAMQAGEFVFELLDEPIGAESGEDTDILVQNIVFDKVNYTYPNREQAIFNDLNLTLPTNRIIGIVGESGSGKSTLMKLLMRWYDVNKGAIVLDNQTVNCIDKRAVQRAFAYIPQKPHIFSQTIRDNLTLGKDIPDETLLEVADKCQIKEKILSTPQGLDTVLNAEQSVFSSGELQRLELTRALLKEAPCYIFDEPTSFLDSLNEAAILKTMKEHCEGTVFLISHRDSTVSCADVVYRVVDKQFVLEKEK